VWEKLGADSAFRRRISMALGVNETEGPAVVESILVSLEGQVNLWHIREFRKYDWLTEKETLKRSHHEGTASPTEVGTEVAGPGSASDRTLQPLASMLPERVSEAKEMQPPARS
jgi:hypothetical protein